MTNFGTGNNISLNDVIISNFDDRTRVRPEDVIVTDVGVENISDVITSSSENTDDCCDVTTNFRYLHDQ